ncbi:hypothetical protein AQUCO_28800002v1 [Aquilegia coerulea]|uniref:Uncharacterized protein n=1 Tax=Aquilegia coerulea TaxID=218851 RepID=A0A2G5C0J0_AQUCA|nr:hypothetical protein AQUCO_28800002v1 [Aquilegia coerulea]
MNWHRKQSIISSAQWIIKQKISFFVHIVLNAFCSTPSYPVPRPPHGMNHDHDTPISNLNDFYLVKRPGLIMSSTS